MRLVSRLFGLTFLLATLVGGCGSGSNGETETPTPLLPEVTRFTITDKGNQTLTTAVTTEKGTAELTFRDFLMMGTCNTKTHAHAMENNLHIQLDTGSLFDTLIVHSSLPMSWQANGFATAGAFSVEHGTDVITVTVDPSIPGGGGVVMRITPQTGTPQSLSVAWKGLEELAWSDSSPEFVRIGALVYGALDFLWDRLDDMIHRTELIARRERSLRRTPPGTPIQEWGDLLPLLGSRGSEDILWIDSRPPIGQVASGDNFTFTFHNLWFNDPLSDSDSLFAAGTLQLQGFVREATPFQVGFERAAYENVMIRETVESPTGSSNFSFGDTIRMNGSFTIVFKTGSS